MNYGEPGTSANNNSSKLSTTLFDGEDNMAISAPTTAASNSINHIHIQYRTFIV
jgi:hypothetical protein